MTTPDSVPDTFSAGKYTLHISPECRQQLYVWTDLVQGENELDWTIHCERSSHDLENKIDVWSLDELEGLIDDKRGIDPQAPQEREASDEEPADDESESEETVEAGGFVGWVKDAITGVKTFILGEIACKGTDNSQPVKGNMTSFEGRVFVLRGVKRFAAEEGMSLLAGDAVYVKEESSATLELVDTGKLTVNQKVKFQIPKTKLKCARKQATSSVVYGFGKAWNWLKDVVQGEKYELRTPSSAAGYRG